MRVELVVTDLDGTLWHSRSEVTPAVRDAWLEVTATVPILVATGRRLTSTRVPLARAELPLPPAVVLNGALGLDLATGKRFHRSAFPPSQAQAVLESFRDAGLEPCIYVDADEECEVVVGDAPSTNPGHLASLGTGVGITDLDHVVAEWVVLAFGIIGVAHGRLAAAAQTIEAVAIPHLDRSLDYPGMASLTVAPEGQSKWDGVVAYCGANGIDHAGVVAVADGPNDVELLANAAVAVVPESAHPSAAALAHHTIRSAADGGWADLPKLLEQLL